jgi:dGTPase
MTALREEKRREKRLHGHDPHLGHRSDFRRDRDSIFYSNYFRRLAGVTQVVHAAEGHVFHNRLVHSVKVAQIGQSLADVLTKDVPGRKKIPEEVIKAVGEIDGDVVQTACLAHDLGHPPFGHIAEWELDQCAKDHGVPDGFEGNAQSFRIVTRNAIHDERHKGLNLTSASLNALLKYPWPRHQETERKEHNKWGYYEGDQPSFELARRREAAGSERKSVEADIMDWADDIAYSIHDLDDFYRAGIVPLDRILAGGTERDRFLQWIEGKGIIERARRTEAGNFIQSLRPANGADLLMPFQGTTAQYHELRRLETKLIQRFLGLLADDQLKLDPDGTSRLQIAPELKREVEILKGLMRFYVYEAPALVAQQHGQRKLIRGLFEILFEAVNPVEGAKKAPSAILPKPFDERLDEIRKATIQGAVSERVRLVTDVIASLTEQQAASYYARLSGTSLGFLADRIFGA